MNSNFSGKVTQQLPQFISSNKNTFVVVSYVNYVFFIFFMYIVPVMSTLEMLQPRKVKKYQVIDLKL